MKNYLTLTLLVIFAVVLDIYAIKGLGAEQVASFRREYLYQYFSGSVMDWVGLGIVNATWLFVGIAAAKEVDFYEETPWPYIWGFLGLSTFGVLFIYWM